MTDRLARLREAFDRAFQEPPPERGDRRAVLAVRVGGEPFAMRLDDLGGLMAAGALTPLPGAPPELLGVMGVRGQVVPVFSLSRLLGLAPDSSERWLALSPEEPLALAFHDLEGQRWIGLTDVVPADRPELVHEHVREAVRLEDGLRRVLEVADVMAHLRARGAKEGG